MRGAVAFEYISVHKSNSNDKDKLIKFDILSCRQKAQPKDLTSSPSRATSAVVNPLSSKSSDKASLNSPF
jgi:hypothetical protein